MKNHEIGQLILNLLPYFFVPPQVEKTKSWKIAFRGFAPKRKCKTATLDSPISRHRKGRFRRPWHQQNPQDGSQFPSFIKHLSICNGCRALTTFSFSCLGFHFGASLPSAGEFAPAIQEHTNKRLTKSQERPILEILAPADSLGCQSTFIINGPPGHLQGVQTTRMVFVRFYAICFWRPG